MSSRSIVRSSFASAVGGRALRSRAIRSSTPSRRSPKNSTHVAHGSFGRPSDPVVRRSSRPNDGEPARWSRANARPNPASPSADPRLASSIHSRTRRGGEPASPSEATSTSGTANTAGSRSHRRPFASVVKKPAGGSRCVFANTVRPSVSSTRYDSATSPPLRRRVARTSVSRSSETAATRESIAPSVASRRANRCATRRFRQPFVCDTPSLLLNP